MASSLDYDDGAQSSFSHDEPLSPTSFALSPYGRPGSPREEYASHESIRNGQAGSGAPISPTSAKRFSSDSLIAGSEVRMTRLSLQESTVIEPPAPDPNDYVDDVVQPGFDEAILRTLCDMDGGVPLLLDRIKQSMVSCREASIFLKKRAVLEDEYGRGLQKLAKQTSEIYALNDGKAGTYVAAWHSSMKIHEIIGDNHVKFASRLNEMSEELISLSKEVDKNRKSTKDLAARYERTLQESETALEKSKTRFDVTGEELQRFLISKEGESSKEAGMMSSGPGKSGNKRVIGKAVAKGGMLLKGRNPGNLQRQEEDIRSRMSSTSDSYRKAVLETQTLRQEYFNFQLPRILRSLKECADEIDLGLQYHLSRYAFLIESTALNNGTTLSPSGTEDGPGIKFIIASIDNQHDFKVFMQNYAVAHAPRGPRREGPWEEGFLPPLPSHQSVSKTTDSSTSNAFYPTNSIQSSSPSSEPQIRPSVTGTPTFGVHLAEQMTRDGVDLPKVVEKCCTAISANGLDTVGIYRLSGTKSKIHNLKVAFDRDVDAVDLSSPEWSADINNIASALKLWFRELPEPLLTFSLYQGFIDAAKIENDRLRHIRLHERVNDLPDPNYATLKYLMGHLHEVTQRQSINQMSVSNLSIVFGPTLLGPPPLSRNQSTSGHGVNGSISSGGVVEGGGTTLQDMNWQCKAIETILEHYTDIFVDEEEETSASAS